jgi:hypothetical protein
LASLAEQRLLEMRASINGDLRGLSDELAATNKQQAKHGQRLDNLETRQVIDGRARGRRRRWRDERIDYGVLLGLQNKMQRVVNQKLTWNFIAI